MCINLACFVAAPQFKNHFALCNECEKVFFSPGFQCVEWGSVFAEALTLFRGVSTVMMGFMALSRELIFGKAANTTPKKTKQKPQNS